MGGAVFPLCWLFGLRPPRIAAHQLLSGARSWWENGGLQEGSCQELQPLVSLSSQWANTPTSTRDHPILASKSDPICDEVTAYYPDSWCARDLMYTLKSGVSVTPVLWNSCNQISLTFKGKFIRGSSSHSQTPKLGTLTWARNFHSRWENFGGMIIFQLVGNPPGVYGIWFYQIVPPPPSHWGSFVFGCRISFLIGSSIFLLMLVQQLVVILVFP